MRTTLLVLLLSCLSSTVSAEETWYDQDKTTTWKVTRWGHTCTRQSVHEQFTGIELGVNPVRNQTYTARAVRSQAGHYTQDYAAIAIFGVVCGLPPNTIVCLNRRRNVCFGSNSNQLIERSK